MKSASSNGSFANSARSRGGERLDVVVKAGNLHLPALVDQRRQHRAQRVGRIGHRAAERAGVQVLLGAGQPQLEIGDAAQAVGDRRLAGGELRRVADDDAVAGQPLACWRR